MQNVRRFRGRGFDIGQTLAVDQRRALGRFFLVALLPPHGKKNFAHDLIREARKRVLQILVVSKFNLPSCKDSVHFML